MIDRLLDHFEGEDVIVACIYCDFQDQERQTTANIIGALTRQVVNTLGKVPDGIEEAFKRVERKLRGQELQVSESVKLLQAALTPAKRTFICIDALDECPDKHRSHLLTALHTICQASPGVQLFITGRPHIRDAVETLLPGGVQGISVSTNGDDIREYLEMELKHDPVSSEMNHTLKADIMKHIPQRIPNQYVMVNSISKAKSDH